MNVYRLLVVLLIAAALLMRGYKPKNKGYMFVAGLLLFAVYGLRDGTKIGADALSYLHTFQRLGNYTWSQAANIHDGVNAAYYLLSKAIYEMTGGDFQALVTLIAAFATFCFVKTVYRFSPNPLQSILIYLGLLLYSFMFTALKQSIAMSFVLLAFGAIVDRKPTRFFLLILVSAQFHYPSLVFLPAYWIAKFRPGRNYVVLLVAVLAVVFVFHDALLNLMLNAYGDEESTNTSAGMFLRTKSIVMILIFIMAVLIRRPQREDMVYCILLEFLGLAIVFQTFCGYSNVFERLADYYFQFAVLFIPMIFDKRAERHPLFNWRIMGIIDLTGPYLFCIYSIYRFVTSSTASSFLYPYKFFFE